MVISNVHIQSFFFFSFVNCSIVRLKKIFFNSRLFFSFQISRLLQAWHNKHPCILPPDSPVVNILSVYFVSLFLISSKPSSVSSSNHDSSKALVCISSEKVILLHIHSGVVTLRKLKVRYPVENHTSHWTAMAILKFLSKQILNYSNMM